MPSYPPEIYKEDLSARWNNTKKLARKKAEDIDKAGKDAAKTQVKAFDSLDKKSFNQSFASNLSKWPTLFPDYKKMKELLDSKIFKAINDYSHATDADKTLSNEVKSILGTQFTYIGNTLKAYDKTAKELTDADLARQQAAGKIPPSIVVLKHPDILRLALEKAGAAPNLGIQGSCPLEIVINDKDILKKFPDDKEYANQSQKIKDKADFAGLIDEIAHAIKAANTKAADPAKLNEAKNDLQTAIEKAIQACAVRATDEAGRQAKLKGEARWANIKSGLKLTLTGVGVAAGATAIALTPFTAGVSTIAGCVALSKSVVELTRQIYTLGADLNTLTASAANDIKGMKNGYDQWLALLDKNKENPKSWEIGITEFGKRSANALLPTWVTTIKSVKEKVEACEQKCNNIEVKSNDIGEKLSKMLTEQGKADKAIEAFIKTVTKSITPKENEALVVLLKKLIATEKATGELIDDVMKLNKKVSAGQTAIANLAKDLKPIDAANPVWSKVASALFETTASAGYMFLAGSGAPEPFEFAKEIAEVAEKTHHVVELLEMSVNLGEGLEDAFKKKSKH